MRTSAFESDLWRSNLKRWLVPLVLVLAMAALLTVYRSVYGGRVAQLKKQFQNESETLASLQTERARNESFVAEAEASRLGMESLYRNTFSTERQRLTRVIGDVRRLATQAGLNPESISYPEEELEDFGLKRKVISFSVEGDYASLRRFINFLELSDNFLTLEKVDVTGGDGVGGLLSIRLELSTIFAEEETLASLAQATRSGAGSQATDSGSVALGGLQ